MSNEKAEIDFYDTNFWIGENYLSKKNNNPIEKLNIILNENKKSHSITGVNVSSFLSYYYHAKTGNNLVAEIISNNQEIKVEKSGSLVMEQEYLNEPENFEAELLKRYEQGFKILRLFPKTHKYPYEVNMFKRFYEICNYLSFPVMISLDELDITGNKQIEWFKILEITEKFNNVPLIIDGGNSKELSFNNYLLFLLKNSNNIFFNTHNLLCVNQIEELSKACNSDRLIFDSNFPFYKTEVSVERINNAFLSVEDKRKISGLNINKIFSNIKI